MNLKVKLVGLVLLFVLATHIVIAQQATDKSVDSIPLDPKLCHGKLKNGLTYYINNVGKADISLALVVKAGWENEDADQLGLAHLIEHVLMQGGTTHGEGGVNGFRLREGLTSYPAVIATSTNYTVYSWSIPSGRPELMVKSLEMLRDYAHDTLVVEHLKDPKIVDNERKTVLEEFGGYDRKAFERIYKILGEPKGHREYDPAIAYDKHNEYIKTFKLEPLIRFYKEWYRPNLQAVIIAGDVDTALIRKEIEDRFSDLKNPENAREKTFQQYLDEYAVKLNNKNQLIIFTNKNIQEITLEILMKKPASDIALATKEQFKIKLIKELYNKMMGTRFKSLTQMYNPPCKHAFHYIETLPPPDAQLDVLHTTINIEDQQSIRSAFKHIFTELERAKRHGFMLSELIKAKNELLKEEEQSEVNASSSTSIYDYQNHFVFGSMAPSSDYKLKLINTLLKNISLEEINKITKVWLSGDVNRAIIINAPEKDKNLLPNEAEMTRWIKEVSVANIAPYKNADVTKPLMSLEAINKLSYKGGYKQSEIKEIGVTKLNLANGVKLVLKPLKSSNNSRDEILLQGFGPGGASSYKKEDYYSAIKSTEIITNSGVAGFNKFELERCLTGKKIFVAPFISSRSKGFQGSSSITDLETMLQLVYQYFVSPNKNRGAYADWLSTQHRELSKKESSATYRFFDNIKIAMQENQENFNLKSLEQIQFERAYEIYKESFADASGFTFVITGGFDVEKIKPLLLKYFGPLPATHKKELPEKLEVSKRTNGLNKIMYSSENENSMPVALIFSGDYAFSEKNNSIMDVLGSALRSVLWVRLMEKEGTYGIVSGVRYQSHPEARYQVRIQFQSDTNGIERRIAAVLEEIGKLRQNGPDTKVFEGALAEVKQKLKRDLESNQFWGTYLSEKYQNGEDPIAIMRCSEILDKITKEDVKAAAQKYLDKENFNRFVLLPESMKSK